MSITKYQMTKLQINALLSRCQSLRELFGILSVSGSEASYLNMFYSKKCLEIYEKIQTHKKGKHPELIGCEGCKFSNFIDRPSVLIHPFESLEMPKVPDFPIDLIPEPFKTYIKELAYSLDCPVDYVGMGLLTIWSGFVGNRRKLLVTNDWLENCILWTAIIGSASTMKSPPLNKMIKDFIVPIEIKYRKNHDELMKEHEASEDKKDRPVLQEKLTSDATREAVASLLKNNPDGILYYRDELTGFLNSFDEYKGKNGSDKQFWLSIWNNAYIKLHRKSNHDGLPITIENPFVSIIGGLIPEYLMNFKSRYGNDNKLIDDGLNCRFLPVYPEKTEGLVYDDRYVKEEAFDAVENCFQHYESIENNTIHLSQDAKKSLFEWVNEINHNQIELIEDNTLISHFGKLKSYVMRFALIFHTINEASGEEIYIKHLSKENAERAINLVEGYIKPHILKAYNSMNQDPDDQNAKLIISLIKKRYEENLSCRIYQDIKQNRTINRKLNAKQIGNAISLLESKGYGFITKNKEFYLYEF